MPSTVRVVIINALGLVTFVTSPYSVFELDQHQTLSSRYLLVDLTVFDYNDE